VYSVPFFAVRKGVGADFPASGTGNSDGGGRGKIIIYTMRKAKIAQTSSP